MKASAIVLLLASSLIFALIPGQAGADQIPSTIGDWEVTGEHIYDGGSATVTGNITVRNSASLTLQNLTIIMDGQAADALSITVEQGGTLFVHQSTIKAFEPMLPYKFMLEPGSHALILGSTIQNVGSPNSLTGFEVHTDDATIKDTTLTSNFHGIVVDSANPKIDNSTITNGLGLGIVVQNGARPTITNSIISGFSNGAGIYLETSDVVMKGDSIRSNRYGLSALGSVGTIEECTFQSNVLAGISISSSSLTITDSDILDNYGQGIRALSSSSLEMHGVVIEGNIDDGLQVMETTAQLLATTIEDNSGDDISISGDATVAKSVARLVDSEYGTLDFGSRNPDSRLEAYWYMTVNAKYESGIGPVEGATIFLQDAAGDFQDAQYTGPDGTWGPAPQLSYIVDINGQTKSTPYVLTVRNNNQTNVTTADISKDNFETTLVFDDVMPQLIKSKPVDGTLTSAETIDMDLYFDKDTIKVLIDGEEAVREEYSLFDVYSRTLTLVPGLNTIQIEAEDDVRNILATTLTVVRDNVPPVLTIIAPAVVGDNPIFTNTALVEIEGRTEIGATLVMYESEGTNGTLIGVDGDSGLFSQFVYLAEGQNSIRFEAKDPAGNTATATLVMYYDPVTPTLTLWEPDMEHTNAVQITISGMVDDPGAKVKVSINTQSWDVPNDNGQFVTQGMLSEGTNQITVTAVDTAGNSAIVRRAVVLDTIPPQLVVDSPENGLVTNDKTILVEGMTDDNAILTVNGAKPYRNGLNFNAVVDLVEGQNRIDVVSKDKAGNTKTVRLTVTRDSIPPTIDVLEPENGFRTAGETVTIEGVVSEDARLIMNGKAVNVLEDGTFTLTVELDEGENLLAFTAEDRAGNVGTRPFKAIKDSIVILEVYEVRRVSKDQYFVSGRTDEDATLSIDGVRFPVSDSGFYSVVANVKEGTDFTIETRDKMGNTNQLVVTAPPPPGPPAAFNWGPVVMWVSVLTVVAVIGAAGSTERGKLFALFYLFVPLYTKMKKNTVLDHYTRGQIHGYIVANPGDHYNSIKEALKLNNGTLAYHLRILEKEGIVKSRTDGIYKRFYPMGMKVPETNGTRLTEIQKIILKRIKETPGISQKEMARLVGVSPSTVNYHISILKSAGLVRSERRGMRIGYYLERFEDLPRPVKESFERNIGRKRRKTGQQGEQT